MPLNKETQMKIVILSRNAKLYSTRRLIESAEQRGHEVRVLDVLRCYMNITSMRPSIHYKGENITDFDAVIPRIGASVTFTAPPFFANSR
jgi:ribosomal protein S6--L-glutamate ligase